MRVIKVIELDGTDRSAELRGMFECRLLETCVITSQVYAANMKAFDEILQEIAQKAFDLGQASCK